MSWSLVALILGCVWVLPVMYIIKWYYMNKMFSRNNLRGVDLKATHDELLRQAGELEPLQQDDTTASYPAEG